jgi:hypothetical protein
MSDQTQFSRRNLLLGGAIASAAAAGASIAAAQPSAPDTASEDHRRVVLKDTPHTRTYYALARD